MVFLWDTKQGSWLANAQTQSVIQQKVEETHAKARMILELGQKSV